MYRGIITFPKILGLLQWLQPQILMPFSVAGKICWFMFWSPPFWGPQGLCQWVVPQPVSLLPALSQEGLSSPVQDSALAFAKFHDIPISPCLQPCQVPLKRSPALVHFLPPPLSSLVSFAKLMSAIQVLMDLNLIQERCFIPLLNRNVYCRYTKLTIFLFLLFFFSYMWANYIGDALACPEDIP